MEPFLLISKSAKGAAAAKLVQDATAAPGVFVFAELLERPNIQEALQLAANPQHAPYLALLQLFSYRTYRDYLEHKDALPPLNPAQITKLKYLTIASLAAERHVLPYTLLLDELHVATIRELEDLIIDAIYLDVIRGRLDHKAQHLEVEYTMGRDLEPGKLDALLGALQNWAATTAAVLAELDQKLMETATYDAAVHADNEDHERVFQANLKEVHDRLKDGKARRGLDSMDIDEPAADGPKLRNRKFNSVEAMMMKQTQRKRNRM